MKLRTKVMLLVFCAVFAILLLNQYPVSMSLQQSVTEVAAEALGDVIDQASKAPDVIEGLSAKDSDALAKAAERVEDSRNCDGLAIVDESYRLCYRSDDGSVSDAVLAELKADSDPEAAYLTLRDEDGREAIYLDCPVYEDGQQIGTIIAKMVEKQNNPGIQKAQRDLNAITVLVLIIALIFVWELTDNITSTMFNLEPVEIAQLLVERNALIDSVRDGILSVDREGRLLHTNRRALEIIQTSVPHFDSKTSRFEDLFPHVTFEPVFSSQKPLYDVECLVGADSYYVNFIPIRIEKPAHESLLVTLRPKQEVLQFAENITSVRSYIEALRSQMHEFNNKLQVMSGLVQAKKYPELEEYLYGLVKLKNREMEQISHKLADPILAAFLMSKFDRASEQKVDLVFTDDSQLDAELPEVLVQDLVVIIGNLLENAFDAVQDCDMRTVTLEITEKNGVIAIDVWDSGSAIPEELREAIFDYGVTSKKDGNGIGLFLVQQACQHHDGYITVSSEEGEGTEFVVHLPYGNEV